MRLNLYRRIEHLAHHKLAGSQDPYLDTLRFIIKLSYSCQERYWNNEFIKKGCGFESAEC